MRGLRGPHRVLWWPKGARGRESESVLEWSDSVSSQGLNQVGTVSQSTWSDPGQSQQKTPSHGTNPETDRANP